MSGYRLKDKGTLIDASKKLKFTFDGVEFNGYKGDTFASAMLASGEKIMARSFKYHRPRGVYCAGPEEPNALVSLRNGDRHEPNCPATTIELFDGLTAKSQNAWPSLNFDVMAINQAFAPLLVAGFYYKTFMGTGQRFWHCCEHFIRNAAGMGKAGLDADPDRYEKNNLFADVLIVGAGPAGLIAAKTIASTGAKILLVDENSELGGSLPEEVGTIDGQVPINWALNIIQDLSSRPNVTIKPRTTVYGYFDDNVLGAVERVADHKAIPSVHEPRQRHHKIFAKRVIIATGSLERPIVFEGNDIPGVMLANAGLRYAKRYGVAVGKEVVVFTNNDDGYQSAFVLKELGVNITAIIDPRQNIECDLRGKLDRSEINSFCGYGVISAKGGKTLKAIDIAPYNSNDESISNIKTLNADALLVSGGYTPTINLCSQTGTPAVFVDEIQSFIPGEATRSWNACGAVMGQLDLDNALKSGIAGAIEAAAALNLNISERPKIKVEGAGAKSIPLPLTEIPSANKSAKKFIDLQHDVTVNDLQIAHREGFRSVEHLKRYTTMGMASDQGKTSNMNALALMANERGITIPEAGTTRFRAPYKPIALGALAGRDVGCHYQPLRRTPMHNWHLTNGAEMVEAGIWHRPRVYKKANETVTEAYIREARAVRKSVGIVDVTSLGKIDVQGPDAAEFINRIYANAFLKLPVGKARYGVMLREDGIMYDDGTSWRLGESQFLVTTTTSNAAKVLSEMERMLSIIWPDLKVKVCSITDQWAGMAVAGPNSWKVLEKVITDIDFSEEGFPFMAVRDGHIGHIPVKLARLSFSGERAYEVYCGYHYGAEIWESIIKAGKPFEITPYGTEALGTLRIEKGHISGPELDGRTTMADVGLGRMASTKKSYIGSVLKSREGLRNQNRMTMVGLISTNDHLIRSGSHIVNSSRNIGYVSSSTYSPALEKYIALAFIEGAHELNGTLEAVFPLKKEKIQVEIVDPCFYDKEGKRLHE